MPFFKSTKRQNDKTQTPGAGPSRLSPFPVASLPEAHVSIEIPSVKLPEPACLAQEVELGTFLVPQLLTAENQPDLPSGIFSRRGSNASVSTKVSTSAKSFFLASSYWQTDILTFCSHARLDPVLGDTRITHIQARKSRRPPFLHEYLLVFFSAARDQRFVIRIDRLGKIGSNSTGWPFGRCTGRHGEAANTAIQEVGLYHIQDAQSGIDTPGAPWLAMDGRWGSRPIATLATWESARAAGTHVSHHVQTATGGLEPALKDVSRLLEAILLEMPTYHLTTTNCYFMTRSSLLLLQQCYPTVFACYIGSMSGELVQAADLAEPVWEGLIRWYLPFVLLFFLVYIPFVVLVHMHISNLAMCHRLTNCAFYQWKYKVYPEITALRFALHAIIDVPLPTGILHAYMTALESAMNKLVERLSRGFLGAREERGAVPLEYVYYFA
ncbi:hypothetical protein FRC09_003264 [Ceratobasidium sp. 395]|nr:hypothetical protein FRC09_003264 [Ceratobasidium sp. 395]